MKKRFRNPSDAQRILHKSLSDLLLWSCESRVLHSEGQIFANMAEAQVTDQAFVTLATNDSYGLGALTLGHSLRRVGTTRMLVCMVTSDLSNDTREELAKVFELVDVNILDSHDTVNLALLTRPDLGVTFTKLHCWRLTQYSKCVFMDADTLVLQNIDDLFEREELSAASDIGWPDCFNSGVFVFKPSEETYAGLLQFALSRGSFDGGDQGLLNAFFSDWATKDIRFHVPFLYNVVAQAFYTYKPAFKRFGKDAKVIHFIGMHKPWHATYHPDTGCVDCPGDLGLNCQEFVKLWWEIFTSNVKLSSAHEKELGLSRQRHGCGDSQKGYSKEQLSDQRRQQSWEKGDIDYMGIDSFQFIQQQLENVTGKSSGNSHHNESDRKAEVPQFPMPSPANKVLPSTPSEVAKSETHNYSEHHGEKPQEIKKTGLVLQSTKPLGLEKMTLSSPMQTSPISPQGATGISFRSSSTVHAPVGSQHHHHQGASAVKIVTKGRNK